MTVAWSVVATQWVLGDSLNGLYSFIKPAAALTLVGADNSTECDANCTLHIQRMTRFYKMKLMDRFVREYPDTLEAMELDYTRRLQAKQEFQNYKTTVSGINDPVSQVTYGGFSYAMPLASTVTSGVLGNVQKIKPGLYFFDSSKTAINSSLLASVAQPGDYAGDTNPAAQIGLYLNRGTLAVPVWNAADSQGLVDYIYNPTILLDAGYIRTLFYMKGYGTFMDNGDWDERIKSMPTAAGISMKEALELETLAFGLIKVDRTGNGIISDSDKGASAIRNYIV